jgi:hypothetical protein
MTYFFKYESVSFLPIRREPTLRADHQFSRCLQRILAHAANSRLCLEFYHFVQDKKKMPNSF